MEDRFKFRYFIKDSSDPRVKSEMVYSKDFEEDGFFHLFWKNYGQVNYESEVSLMQCTGDWDIDNKLIYEGDLLSFVDEEDNKGLCEVVFDQEDLQFKFIFRGNHYQAYEFELSECKIIGNIHENPELLNKTEE